MSRPRIPGLPLWTLVLLLLGCGSAPVLAQPPEGSPWGFSFDLGAGSAALDVGGQSTDREIGGEFGARAAYAFRPGQTLGVAVDFWTGNVGGTEFTFGVIGPTWTGWLGRSGVFARAVLGVGTSIVSGDGGEAEDTGIGAFGALGYEFPVTRTVLFGPQVSYGYINVGEDVSADFLALRFTVDWFPAPTGRRAGP